MKRLTKRVNGVVVYVGTHNDTATGQIPCEVSAAGVRELMEQLARYEDNGERMMFIAANIAVGTFAKFWKSCEAKEPIMQAEQVEERRGKATVNCLRCNFRHEDNGNCTAVGGFCTAVPAAHCQLLRQYLDTGMTPEAFQSYVVFLQDLVGDQKASEALDRFRELVKADRDGRLVVLGHPRRRVMWGDVEPDKLLCPECGNELDGLFPEQTNADLEMVNCPYCGEYLNWGGKRSR